jgi:hypothetical protein
MADHRFVVIGPAAGKETLQQHGSLKLHQHHQLDGLSQLPKQPIKGNGLGQIAGESIQKPASLMALKAVTHDRQHEGITHEFTPGHHGLSLLPKGSGGLHFGPQQIPRREVQQVVGGGKALSLSALTGPGGAEKQQALLHEAGACELMG